MKKEEEDGDGSLLIPNLLSLRWRRKVGIHNKKEKGTGFLDPFRRRRHENLSKGSRVV